VKLNCHLRLLAYRLPSGKHIGILTDYLTEVKGKRKKIYRRERKGVKSEIRISKFETNSNYRNIKYCFPQRRQGAEILERNVGMVLGPEAGMRG